MPMPHSADRHNPVISSKMLADLSAMMDGDIRMARNGPWLCFDDIGVAVPMTRGYWCETDTTGWDITDFSDAINEAIDNGEAIDIF
jgi:hypothetical protein